jgi:hypothetical protein
MGGCYGTLSRLYGAAASNILEARVVLANGSLVVANAESAPDLFWALRGGGGGLAGVVTEFTARTHLPPRWLLINSVSASTSDPNSYEMLIEQVGTLVSFSSHFAPPPTHTHTTTTTPSFLLLHAAFVLSPPVPSRSCCTRTEFFPVSAPRGQDTSDSTSGAPV